MRRDFYENKNLPQGNLFILADYLQDNQALKLLFLLLYTKPGKLHGLKPQRKGIDCIRASPGNFLFGKLKQQ